MSNIEVHCVQCSKYIRRVLEQKKTFQEKHGIGYVEFCSEECQNAWRKVNKNNNSQQKTLTGHEALKELRKKRGYNQEQIAKALGIGQANYSKIESGSRPMTLKMAKRLGEYFGVDFKKFLRGI